MIREAKGAKYTAALKWQLHLVSPDWIFDSVSKGFMVDPVQYRVGQPAQPVVGDDHTVMNSSVTSIASTVSRYDSNSADVTVPYPIGRQAGNHLLV